jgi:hypothetical protein
MSTAMRRSMALSVVAALTPAFALAGVALGEFRQSSQVTLTTHIAGHSTGIAAHVSSSDATAPGAKPKRALKLVIAFPAGTHFNLGTGLVRTCTLTDTQLTRAFGPTCPSRSQIGTGSAFVNALPMATVQNVEAKVKAFVHGSHSLIIMLFNDPKLLPGTPPIILHATTSGSRLVVRFPRVVYGKSRKYKFAGVTAVIVSLKLNVPAMGTGSQALITAGTCTSSRFVVSSRFTYADHTTAVVRTRSRCS